MAISRGPDIIMCLAKCSVPLQATAISSVLQQKVLFAYIFISFHSKHYVNPWLLGKGKKEHKRGICSLSNSRDYTIKDLQARLRLYCPLVFCTSSTADIFTVGQTHRAFNATCSDRGSLLLRKRAESPHGCSNILMMKSQTFIQTN